MAPDDFDERAAPDPGAGGGVGIEVVDGPAGGVASVERFPGRPIGGGGHRLIDLPIHHAGEGALLVDNPGDGIGEGRVVDPVENDGAYSYLAAVRLSSGLGRDDFSQQVQAGGLTGVCSP